MTSPFRLLALGPCPPPLTGTPVTFQIFLDEAAVCEEVSNLTIVDASPGRLKQEQKSPNDVGLNVSTSNISQAWRIISEFTQNVWSVDRVLLFGGNGFVVTLAPVLLFIAKIARKPCYLRVFGGSLDQYAESIPAPLKWVMYMTLKRFDGVFVQTKLLHSYFTKDIGNKLFYIPGFRQIDATDNSHHREIENSSSPPLRMAFLGIVKEEKGVFVLLESLRLLNAAGNVQVQCDIFGAIPENFKERFSDEIERTEGATYCGVIDWQEVTSKLSEYDLLVHPTFYQGEGHPGVLIEAMIAGIPAISTYHRSIPEVIEDEINGLLVEPRDPASLVAAIERLALNRTLLANLASNNHEKASTYDASTVVPSLLRLISA